MAPRFKRPKKSDGKLNHADFIRMIDTLESLANMRVVGGKFQMFQGGSTLDVTQGVKSVLRHAQLTANLSAAGAGAPLEDATTATFKFLEYDSTGASSEPYDLKLGATEYTLVNRSQDLSGTDEDYILVAQVYYKNGSEWIIVAKDC